MEKSRLEWSVGLFVLIGLSLLASLMVLFSKGASAFKSTYTLRLKTTNVGLLIPGAPVLMAGVKVGNIDRIELDRGGKSVTLWAKILNRYEIHNDARFVIDQIGFLGDQFISVIPQQNAGALLKAGDQVACEEPFNMQNVARSSMGLIHRVDQMVQKLNEAITRIGDQLLTEQTVTNLTGTISNLLALSERVSAAVGGFEELVLTNKSGIRQAVTNLVLFSKKLDTVASEFHEFVGTNRVELTTAIKNVRAATDSVNGMLSGVQDGQGLAGFFLKDETVKHDASLMISNLTVLSSNLNKFGLLYKPKKSPAASSSGRKP